MPVRELHEAFTPTADEVAWAREQTRTPEHLLALVVLLKSCRPLGYFPVLAEVPSPVTEHIRGVLELKPDVQARHDSDRTLRQHKSLVRARLGITADPGRAREVAGQAIRAAAQTKLFRSARRGHLRGWRARRRPCPAGPRRVRGQGRRGHAQTMAGFRARPALARPARRVVAYRAGTARAFRG